MPSIEVEAETLTQNAYAVSSRGFSKQRMGQYVHDDGLSLNGDGTVDPIIADNWIAENVQRRTVGPGVLIERQDARTGLLSENGMKFGELCSTIRERDAANVLAARALILSLPTSECERGEDAAKSAYEKALDEDLPPTIEAIVRRQYHGVKENHDRIRDLRNQAAHASS